jgi:hypothetical protein
MKTTIELLNNEIECISLQLFDGFLTFNEFMEQREALFEKAKEMEKEQINDAHYEGSENYRRQYYNETFKSE